MAAESGHAKAMSFLGAYYCDALHGFEPCRDKAVHYWTIAADKGDSAAAGWLATLLYREGGPLPQIKALLKKACSGPEPHVDACFLFAEMHRTGDRINKNWIDAHKYLLKAANAEHAGAAYSLAKLVEEQQVDPEQGRYWLERAAEWGHAAARGLLTSESDSDQEKIEGDVTTAVALQGYTAEELSFNAGDVLTITERHGFWWSAQLNGKAGFVPSHHFEAPEGDEAGQDQD